MKPKKFILITAIIYSVLSSGCTENQNVNFTISGQIKNPQNGKIVLTQLEDINRKKTRVIGEIKVDKKGNFEQTFDLEPHIYSLDIYGKKTVTLAIDKGQNIVINTDTNDLSNLEIKGSEDTDKFLAYEKFRNESLTRLVKSVRTQISEYEKENKPENKTKIEELGLAEIKNYEKHREELNDFIETKMGTSIAVYPTTLRWDGDENIPFYEGLANSFTEKYPDLEITKRIHEKVEILKNTSIGGNVPEINMPDKDGKKIALSDVKGKFVLIDFWASWCGPCRRESEIIAGLYEKYNNQGFEIYGVSLDSEKEDWLSAIEQDKRVWTNVSTLQGFETLSTFDYGVTALPSKFIIDSKGKIIAKNLHGEELKEKINSLFTE